MIKVKQMDESEVHEELHKMTSNLNHKIAELSRDLIKKIRRYTKKDKDILRKKSKKAKHSEEFILDTDSNDDTNGTNKTNAIEVEEGEGGKDKGIEKNIFESVEDGQVKLDNSDTFEDRKYEDEEDKGDHVNDSESSKKGESAADSFDPLKAKKDEDGNEKKDEGTEDEEGEIAEDAIVINNDEDNEVNDVDIFKSNGNEDNMQPTFLEVMVDDVDEEEQQ